MAAGLNESYAYARVSFPRASKLRSGVRADACIRVHAAYNYNITYEIMKLILYETRISETYRTYNVTSKRFFRTETTRAIYKTQETVYNNLSSLAPRFPARRWSERTRARSRRSRANGRAAGGSACRFPRSQNLTKSPTTTLQRIFYLIMRCFIWELRLWRSSL